MKSFKAVAIGGSNTVMKPGYLPDLPRAYAKYGIELNVVKNLAVGNTTILMGLINAQIDKDVLAAADVLLIEYSINDTAIYAASTKAMRAWLKSMEAVIRFARKINPNIVVLPIIFATKTGTHRDTINVLHSGLHYLSSYYGLPIADVNVEMVKRFGRDFFEVEGVYQDFAHYQRPIFTTLAGEIIAEKTAAHLLSAAPQSYLPDPIDPENYETASVFQMAGFSGLEAGHFKNYLYDETTSDLKTGQLKFSIEDGQLLGLKYACTTDVARLYFCVNGEWNEVNTLQPGMAEGKYKFLISLLTLEDIIPRQEGKVDYVLTSIRPEGVEFKTPLMHGVRPNVTENNFHLASFLHTGKLSLA